MKGHRKEHHVVETMMTTLQTNYAPAIDLLKELKEIIESMPECEERDLFEKDYNRCVKLLSNRLRSKMVIVEGINPNADAVSYKLTKAELARVYQKLVEVFGSNDEEDKNAIPGAR